MDTRYQYEQIDYQVDLPIKIFTQTVERFPFHWHEDLELLFVLDGSLEIRVNQDSFHLEEGDLFLVNGNELHFVNSKTAIGKTHVLALQIDHRYVKKHNINLSEKRFYLNTKEMGTDYTSTLGHIKYILANMMDLILNRKNLYHLKVEKLLLELIVILLEHYELPAQTKVKEIDRDQRLLEILKYMNHHCMDPQLSLQGIADEFSLNPQYLSRYFKLNVGESFKKKLDSIRLNKSLISLRTTNETITEIALKYGFPDSKAYYRVFKEVLGMTPMQYREQYKVEIEKNIPKDYLNINSRESLTNLFKHLKKENRKEINIKDLITTETTYHIDMKQSRREVPPTFTKLITFGYAPHALRRDFTDQLNQIQEEIGFEYVRFHGIFADQLLVYNEKKDGTYYFNFNHIDSLIDNLLEANVKPFIEIGFMPKDLASTEDKIFWWNAFVSPPKDMNRWLALLEAFFKHIINRYGLIEVRNWYFEFWNEPEVRSFWSGTEEEFFTLYENSYKRIKSIDSEIKLGGFGLMSLKDSWLENFESFMREKNICIDFVSFHAYNLTHNNKNRIKKPLPKLDNFSVSENPIDQFSEFGSVMLGDEHHFTKRIDESIQKLQSYNFTEEIWISEWNASINSRDLLHDTCFMGTFIIKNSIQNYWKVSGMGFWTFTDIFEEFQLQQPLFHGGFGLMTYNGIKKAAYHAYYFLSRLGDELIYQEEDMIVTRKGKDYQILLCNYSHPNQLYRSFDYSQLNQTNRYTVFENENTKTYHLQLLGLNGNYLLKKQFVNRKQGSSYDAWVDIGAPQQLDTDTINYLKAKAEPGIHIEQLSIEEEFTTIQTDLQPHEIQLIEIKQQY